MYFVTHSTSQAPSLSPNFFSAIMHPTWQTRAWPLKLLYLTYPPFETRRSTNLGLPDPRDHSSLPLLKRIQAGISRARLQSKNQTGQRVRLPITPPILRQLKDRLSSSSGPKRVVLWAVASSAFFGFLPLR